MYVSGIQFQSNISIDLVRVRGGRSQKTSAIFQHSVEPAQPERLEIWLENNAGIIIFW